MKVDVKHLAEIAKFMGDEFRDGCAIENHEGIVRMITWANFPIGTPGKYVRALSSGVTKVNWKSAKDGGVCSIAEWYKWLGDKWHDAAGEPPPLTQLDVIVNARKAQYDSGKVKPPPYPKQKDGPNWVSPKNKKPSS